MQGYHTTPTQVGSGAVGSTAHTPSAHNRLRGSKDLYDLVVYVQTLVSYPFSDPDDSILLRGWHTKSVVYAPNGPTSRADLGALVSLVPHDLANH